MIETRALCGGYAKTAVIKNLNVKLQNGAVYVITGNKGAGKSTLLALLSGALTPISGEVRINGFDMRTEAAKAKPCVGYLPEKDCLYEDMTSLEFLLYVADVKKLPYNRTVRRIHELLELVDLWEKRDRLIRFLSAMERRRLSILQTALGKEEILLLDAPLRGLNAAEAQTVYALIKHLSKEKTIILTSATPTEFEKEGAQLLLLRTEDITTLLPGDVAPTPSAETLTEEVEADDSQTKKESRVAKKWRLLTDKTSDYEVIDTDDERGET